MSGAVKIVKFEPIACQAPIVAKDEAEHIIWGWASVVTEKGVPVVDLQGDEIPVPVLVKAVHKFMAECRVGKIGHAGGQTGEIVESLVFTKALQDVLGIDLQQEGWFVGYRIDDPEVWKQVQSGDLSMFSIGGTCEYEEAAAE